MFSVTCSDRLQTLVHLPISKTVFAPMQSHFKGMHIHWAQCLSPARRALGL